MLSWRARGHGTRGSAGATSCTSAYSRASRTLCIHIVIQQSNDVFLPCVCMCMYVWLCDHWPEQPLLLRVQFGHHSDIWAAGVRAIYEQQIIVTRNNYGKIKKSTTRQVQRSAVGGLPLRVKPANLYKHTSNIMYTSHTKTVLYLFMYVGLGTYKRMIRSVGCSKVDMFKYQ